MLKRCLTGLFVVIAGYTGMTTLAEASVSGSSSESLEMLSATEFQRVNQGGPPPRDTVVTGLLDNSVSLAAAVGGPIAAPERQIVPGKQGDWARATSADSEHLALPGIRVGGRAPADQDRIEKIKRHRAHGILRAIVSRDIDTVWDSLESGAVFHFGDRVARVVRSNELDVEGEFHTVSRRDEFERLFDLLFTEAFRSRLAANPAVSCCIWHDEERGKSQPLYYWGERDVGDDAMAIVFDTGSVVEGTRGGFETTKEVRIRAVLNARVPAPAFDCMKALRLSEQKICSSHVLSDLDRVLNRKYRALRDELSGDELNTLQSSQRSFLRQRDRCGDRERCIESLYQERNGILQGWIQRSRGDGAARLEKRLVNAMAWDPSSVTPGPETEFQAVINALQAWGYLPGEKAGRWDYVDYWIFQTNFYFKGHRVVLLGHEYPGEWVGCCPSEGLSVVLQPHGALKEVEDFAEAVGCRLFEGDFGLPPGWAESETTVSLGCTERDKRGNSRTQGPGSFQ